MGRSGAITLLLRGLKDLPAEERPRAGERAQSTAARSGEELEQRLAAVNGKPRREALAEERIDITLAGHALRARRIAIRLRWSSMRSSIFSAGMGFEIARGPDIEDDYHNFEALNIPKDHPARDMQDTFFVANGRLLRTHTSPVQIRTMESRKPPLQIIVPGAVYRHDDDATHSPMFHQVEGFMVDQAYRLCRSEGRVDPFAAADFQPRCRREFPAEFFSVHRAERRDRYPVRHLRRQRHAAQRPELPGL